MTHLKGADLEWLQEVHGVETTGAEVALLFGNEDAPDRVEVYEVDDLFCAPTVWRADTDGTLRRITP